MENRVNGKVLSSEDVAGRMELLGMIHAFVTPFVLKAAVMLRIPDIIAQAGPSAQLSAHEIMSRIPSAKCPQMGILQRILSFLVKKNVLQEIVEDETNESFYGLTRVSKWLVQENNSEYLTPLLLMEMNDKCLASWQRLHEVVLEGGDAFDKANGKYFWDYGKEDSSFNEVVNNAMIAFSTTTMSLILQNYDGFKRVRSLVDVGGGMGQSICKIVEAYPSIEGINYDLPHVIATAPIVPGVKHVSGSMFESIPSADAIFLKSVLHNWDDERCMQILRNCHRALPLNGKLIIVDIIFDPSDKSAQIEANLDMIMVAYTTGGKERTPSEWEGLLTSCGFSRISFRSMPTKEGVVEAYKTNANIAT